MRFDKFDLELIAEHLCEVFVQRYFDLLSGRCESVKVEISSRMKARIGLAMLFENRIRLNESYFAANPHYMPYTLFHELTHLWLYHQGFDPGHTKRFYLKMQEFCTTGYLVDPEVYVHSRLAAECRYVYTCAKCQNHWHLRDEISYDIFCGLCWRKHRTKFIAALTRVIPFDESVAIAVSYSSNAISDGDPNDYESTVASQAAGKDYL